MESEKELKLYDSYDENTYPEIDFQVVAHNEKEAIKLLKEEGINTESILLDEVSKNTVKPVTPQVIKLKRRR